MSVWVLGSNIKISKIMLATNIVITHVLKCECLKLLLK